jgi:hypothetical protein
MEVGDLVKVKNSKTLPTKKEPNTLGVIIDIHKIATTVGLKEEYIGIEYKVSIVTNNKAIWYIEDNLELVSEGWRPDKE